MLQKYQNDNHREVRIGSMGEFFDDFIFLCSKTFDGIFYAGASFYFLIDFLYRYAKWDWEEFFTLMVFEFVYCLIFIRNRLSENINKRFSFVSFLNLILFFAVYIFKIRGAS